MKDEEALNRYLAKEQNTLDHLTRKMYGGKIKFEHLSPWGQYTIESLAREHALVGDPDPELRTAKVQLIDLTRENAELSSKLAKTLRDYEELWEENEELRMEIYDRDNEADHTSRRARIRERRARYESEIERASSLSGPEIAEGTVNASDELF